MSEQIDFYTLGCKSIQQSFIKIQKRAEEIEKEYGKEAREEFEIGVASSTQVYTDLFKEYPLKDSIIRATLAFEKINSRNNSYFGKVGTSKQYTSIDSYGVVNYIDPENLNHKR